MEEREEGAEIEGAEEEVFLLLCVVPCAACTVNVVAASAIVVAVAVAVGDTAVAPIAVVAPVIADFVSAVAAVL